MYQELATLPVLPLAQDAPPVSPVILWIVAIVLVILFIWLLLRERRKHGEEVDTIARLRKTQPEEPVSAPDPATRMGGIEAPSFERTVAPAVDDLEIIEGIGPKIASVLNAAGVTSFAQLAAMEPSSISAILQAANLRLADPASWPEQARLAASGDMTALQALQDRLKGGR